MRQRRKRSYVDGKVQGALVLRVLLYWLFCLYGIFFLLAVARILFVPLTLEQPPSALAIFAETWSRFWPFLSASLLFVPLVMYDIVMFSNRFVGPMLRARLMLKRMAQGERVQPIKFRTNDFWSDVATELNQIAIRLQLTAKPLEDADSVNTPPTPTQEPDASGPGEHQTAMPV